MTAKPSAGAILAAHDKVKALRERAFSGGLSSLEQQAVNAALAEAHSELASLQDAERGAEPSPVSEQRLKEISAMSPSAAAAAAKEILARPEYWNPQPAGKAGISPEQHAALVRERAELVKRASETTEGSST